MEFCPPCLVWALVGLLLVAFYKWATLHNDFFEKKGMKYVTPSFLIGNTGPLLSRKVPMHEIVKSFYLKYPKEKIMGIFQFRRPLIILRDPELIKQVGVKEFDNFVDHQTFLKETMDPLFCNTIVGLTGDKWREMRAALSPVFTGSKMRHMFDLLATCSSNMVAVFKAEAKTNGPQVYEMKDLFSRFTNDVVATTAFGLEVNSFKDRDNEVYKLGQQLTDFKGLITSMKMLGFFAFPWFMNMLQIKFLDGVASRYFVKVIRQNFETRIKEKIVRNDVVQLLLQLKKGNLERQEEKAHDDAGFATIEESELGKKTVKREWSELELIAQCFIFYLGGFDTTATMLSFLSYELALNPDVQQRLFEEVAEANERLNGKNVTYEVLQKMRYLDAVVSESLRKWPPATVTDRMATRACTLQVDEANYSIEKGTSFWFPIYALHHDENYFPNPDKFDPERFHDEERRKAIKPYTYLPFGVGPRGCIGSRFALMAVKSAIYHLIFNFSFEVTAKTEIPLQIAKTFAGFYSENGIHIELRPKNWNKL